MMSPGAAGARLTHPLDRREVDLDRQPGSSVTRAEQVTQKRHRRQRPSRIPAKCPAPIPAPIPALIPAPNPGTTYTSRSPFPHYPLGGREGVEQLVAIQDALEGIRQRCALRHPLVEVARAA